jgi:hypothetical protein
MNIEDCKDDVRVIYARGTKKELLGKCGTIMFIISDTAEIVRVKFDDVDLDGNVINTYPCWIGNLDLQPLSSQRSFRAL